MMSYISRPIVCLLIFSLLSFVVYSPAINGEFLYDDVVEIFENPNVHQVFPLSRSLFGYHSLPVRPIPYLTFAINYELGQGDTTGFHVVNTLIHVLNACLLWSILIETLTLKGLPERYQKQALPVAYIVTGIWVVHPLVSMPVYYIYQRMEQLMSFFLLLTLYSSIQFFKLEQLKDDVAAANNDIKRGNTPQQNHQQMILYWQICAVTSCFMGMFCKEVMVIAPVLVLWYDRIFISRSFSEIINKKLYFYLGLFSCILILIALIRWQNYAYVEHKLASMPSPWIYLLTQTKVLCWYLRLTFWPDPLCFEYFWPFAKGLSEVFVYAVMILSLLITTAGLLYRYPRVGFVAGIFFLILGPTSSIKPILSPIFEHRMYLAVLSPILISAIAVIEILNYSKLLNLKQIRILLTIYSLGLILTLGLITWKRGHDYKTMLAIWEDTKNKSSESFRPYFQLCELHFKLGDYIKSRDYALLSIEKEPINSKAYHNLGLAYFKLKEDKKGWECLLKANELSPDVDVTLIALGNHSIAESKYEQACNYYKRAIDLYPYSAEAHHGIAIAMMYLGLDANTIYEHFNMAVSLKPNMGLAHSHFAVFLNSTGQYPQALEHAEIALYLIPDDEENKRNYQMILKKVQQMR